MTLHQPDCGHDGHQCHSDRDRRGTPDVVDLERWGDDEAFLAGIVEGRMKDQRQQGERRHSRHHLEKRSRTGADITDQPRHPHVLAAVQRDHGAKHREPEKQDRRQLVGPDQRTAEDISTGDASEQNDDFEQHQAGGDRFHRRTQPAASGAAGVHDAARRHCRDRAEPCLHIVRHRMLGDRHRALRPACRRRFQATPKPHRRSGSSTRRRIRRRAAWRGRYRAPAWRT